MVWNGSRSRRVRVNLGDLAAAVLVVLVVLACFQNSSKSVMPGGCRERKVSEDTACTSYKPNTNYSTTAYSTQVLARDIEGGWMGREKEDEEKEERSIVLRVCAKMILHL